MAARAEVSALEGDTYIAVRNANGVRAVGCHSLAVMATQLKNRTVAALLQIERGTLLGADLALLR